MEESCELLHSLDMVEMLPDDESPRCNNCEGEFGWLRPRRHCRYCGGSYHGSWVCGGSSAPISSCMGKRICQFCSVLKQNIAMMEEGVEFTRWCGKKSKDKEDCIVRIRSQNGVFVLSWQITCLVKPNDDSTLSFADVDHLQQFIQPATLTTPRQLLIKVESKQKSVLLETRNESLHKRWFKVCQAAHLVSHIVRKCSEIKTRERLEEQKERHLDFQQRRRTWADTRSAVAKKYDKKRCQSSS